MIRRKRNYLVVTSFDVLHNHRLSSFVYERLPVNRRLNEDEIDACQPLLEFGAPALEIRRFAVERFGKHLTTKDVYNCKRRRLSGLLG